MRGTNLTDMAESMPEIVVARPVVRRQLGWRVVGWLVSSLLAILLYWWGVRPDLRAWPGIVSHGGGERRAVALTFDDGPHPLWTPLLSHTLAVNGARGTFFVVGMDAACYPELITWLARDRHEVASHSQTHPMPNLTVLPPAAVGREIDDATRLLTQLTGTAPLLFRPPGGGVDNTVIAALRARDLRMGWWSANIGDAAETDPARVEARLRRALRPGGVLLLHQRGHTLAALTSFFAAPAEPWYSYETFSAVTAPRNVKP